MESQQARQDIRAIARMRRAFQAKNFLLPILTMLFLPFIYGVLSQIAFRADFLGGALTLAFFIAALVMIAIWIGCVIAIHTYAKPVAIILMISAVLFVVFPSVFLIVSLFQYAFRSEAPPDLLTFGLAYLALLALAAIGYCLRVLALKRIDRHALSPFSGQSGDRHGLNRLLGAIGGQPGARLQYFITLPLRVLSLILLGISILYFGQIIGTFLIAALIVIFFTLEGSIFEIDPSSAGQVLLAALGFLLAKGIFVVILTPAAVLVRKAAQFLDRSRYDQVVKADTRPPILLLRSFVDDQVTMKRAPLLMGLWYGDPTSRKLDQELVERFSHIGPVVAIGKPGEKRLPYGAARFYIADDRWKSTVLALAEKAVAIIVVVEETQGVHWEVNAMLSERFVDKTLFAVGSERSSQALLSNASLARKIGDRAPADGRFGAIAAFRNQGHWEMLYSDRYAADDYLMSCFRFFQYRSQSAPMSRGPIT